MWGCYQEVFSRCVKNGLVRIVGAIGKAAHLHVQSHDIFLFTHVGIDTQRGNFFGAGVERERHLIALLGVVGENQIHSAGDWIQGDVSGLVSLLHSLWIGRNIHGEDGFDVLHVVFHLGFLLLDNSFLQPATAGLFWRRADRGLLDLPIRAVLAAIFSGRLLISL